MDREVIIGICVALDIALIAMAYPILISQYFEIGEKYSSKYLIKLFDRTFPQRKIFKPCNLTWLKAIIYGTLLSFIPLILNQPPPFGWDNFIANNSALMLVVLSTGVLVIFIIYWLNMFLVYRGDSVQVAQKIIRAKKVIKQISAKTNPNIYDEKIDYILKTANDFALYASKDRDRHLLEYMCGFYDDIVMNVRGKTQKINQVPKQYLYPTALYQAWYNQVELLANGGNIQTNPLLRKVLGCEYFYGRGEAYSTISENTYGVVWDCLRLIGKNNNLIGEYWEGAYEYARSVQFDVQESNAQKVFEEFHIAFGGLLVHLSNHQSLQYIFTFSKSIPPEYHIFPVGMDNIFKYLLALYEDRSIHGRPWDMRYIFPDVKHLGTIGRIADAISTYLVLLFIRQFGLPIIYNYQDHTAQPEIPKDRNELIKWQGFTQWFIERSNKVLANSILLENTGLKKVIEQKGEEIKNYVDKLRDSINEKYTHLTQIAALKQECVKKFEEDTTKKIKDAFDLYKEAFKLEAIEGGKDDIELSVYPRYSLFSMDRYWFTEDCSDEWKYSFHADSIINNTIKYELPGSLNIFSNRRYLLPQESVIEALNKLIKVLNKENYSFIGVELRSTIRNILQDKNFLLKEIPTTNSYIANRIYVLRTDDMPSMMFKEITIPYEDNKTLYKELKLCTRILDPQKPEDEKLIPKSSEKPITPDQVVAAILFNAIISAKKNRDIVEIRIQSPYEERGIPNLIKDIIPISQPENSSANTDSENSTQEN